MTRAEINIATLRNDRCIVISAGPGQKNLVYWAYQLEGMGYMISCSDGYVSLREIIGAIREGEPE